MVALYFAVMFDMYCKTSPEPRPLPKLNPCNLISFTFLANTPSTLKVHIL